MKLIQINLVNSIAVIAVIAFFPHTGIAEPIEVPNWNFEEPKRRELEVLPEGKDTYMAPDDQAWHQHQVVFIGGPQRYWNPGVPGEDDGKGRFADVGFGGEAPEGKHVGLVLTKYNDEWLPDGTKVEIGEAVRDFEAIGQVLEDVMFDPTAVYTLTVEVGRLPNGVAEGGSAGGPKAGSPEWNGYKVQLLVGGEESYHGGAYDLMIQGGTVIAEDDNSIEIPANEFRTSKVVYTPDPQFKNLAGLPLQIRLCALEGPDHSLTSVVAFDSVKLDGPPASGE